MTDTHDPSAVTPPHPLLRFLLPVLLLHVLLLASLSYRLEVGPADKHGVSVELAPISTPVESAAPPTEPPPTATSQRGDAQRPTRPPEPTPRAAAPAVIASPLALEPAAPPGPVSAATPSTINPASPSVPPATATDANPRTLDWRDEYRNDLRDALARYHHYPSRARRFGVSGEVRVGFAIRRDGKFQDIRLLHSSQSELLDQAALDSVRRLDSFRPLPDNYSDDSWAVSVPLVYRLD